jgi:hypothetical protein
MKRSIVIVVLALTLPLAALAQINWTQHTIDSFFEGGWEICATDVDRDGDVDLLGAGFEASDIVWWENNGSQNFVKHTVDENYSSARSVYAIDLDDDGDVDILGAASGANEVTWWENDGSQSFTKHTIGSYSGAWHVYAIDLDGDGDIDLVTASISGYITWWENDGSENFARHDISSSFSSARVVDAIDMDQDGDLDVLGVSWSADDITWWENDGSQNFTEHTIDGNFDGALHVHANDLDSDGDIDVLGLAYTGSDVTWWENDGSQNFTKHDINTNFLAPTSAYAVDLDADGDMDIVANSDGGGSGAVTWWENDGSQNFSEQTIAPTVNGLRWVCPTDLDNDGDIDVIATCAYSGDAVYWWESDLDPTVGVSMLPDNAPITVPAGQRFAYTGILANNTNQSQTVDVWIMARRTNGALYGPVKQFNNVPLNPGQTRVVKDIRQNVAGVAPYGNYDYIAYCGTYPSTVIDRANFRFGVIPSPLASFGGDWTLEGGWLEGHEYVNVPSEAALLSAYPNPFNAQTTISFEVPVESRVTLEVYNTMGQRVAALVDEYTAAGYYQMTWDASGYSSGIYFYKLTAGDFAQTRRMMLVK